MKFKMGVVQLDTQSDIKLNEKQVQRLVTEAKRQGADFVSLPENIDFIGSKEEKVAQASLLQGRIYQMLAHLARECGIWIHGGSFAEKIEASNKVYNTSIVVNPKGELCSFYRKIHLYDVTIDSGPVTLESAVVEPGDRIVTCDTDFGTVGLSICYDMRFPELYRLLALKGAKILFVPANYTLYTGKDHWEPILRARAIENQCYVVAAAQWGKKSAFQAYGRSMIIDPWGTVLATCPDGAGVITVELDMERVDHIRQQVPSLKNRRPQSYRLEATEEVQCKEC